MKKWIFNILIVGITMGALYWVFNLYFAMGYLLSFIFHECGHIVISKALNVEVKFGGFTPLGAYIEHGKVDSCAQDAIIAMAGPIFGGIVGIICYLIYCLTYNNTFFALALIIVLNNLLNLLPIMPLDGGHISIAISPIISYITLPIIIGIVIKTGIDFKMLLMIIVAICQTYDIRKRYKKENFFKIDKKDKYKLIALYSLLILILLICTIYFYFLENKLDLIESICRF